MASTPFSDNDVDYPIITFQAPGRTFDRLLQERSLSDLKETVRKKLGLGSGSVIQFAQLRHGELVDFEDEDDFDAFRVVAYKQRHANVKVVLTENSVVNAKGSMSPLLPTPVSARLGYGCLNDNSTSVDPGAAAARQKIVLKNEDDAKVNLETPTTKVSSTPLMPSATARQKMPATPTRMTAHIRIETTEQRQKRLEKEKEKEAKAEASAQERAKREMEEEAKAQAPRVDNDAEAKQAKEDELTQEPEEGELLPIKDDAKERSREALRICTPLSEKRRLDLSNTGPSPSPLVLAQPLGNLDSITYPEGIRGPEPELNVGAKEGKFRYDRDFLMQFMSLCKEKPDSLPPLDAIGLEPMDPLSLIRGGQRPFSEASAPSRQASIGSGLPGAAFRGQFQSMGSFMTTPSKSVHFEAPDLVSMSNPTMPFRNPPLQRTANQGGVGPIKSHRTRSKRKKRSEASKVAAEPQAHGPVYGQPYDASQAPNFEPIVQLQMTESRWDRKSFHNNDPDSPEVVDRKVKALLNKLTMEKFDSISDQIIQWANRSENQKDGRTLIQVIRLVLERAEGEVMWSEMYARLCRKMMEQISPEVQDEGIRNSEGNPITGGQLFRKYLLNRCQEDFERGWFAKEATAAADEVALYSDEYYATQKANRPPLGLTKFIGELFKLQMLTERNMHECIRKLLVNVQNPKEEEIESLCKLLTMVGSLLDNKKARAHLDIYFQKLQELRKNVNPRMQFMLQDLIELRDRKWQARNTVAYYTCSGPRSGLRGR